jgi:hypothetical protein
MTKDKDVVADRYIDSATVEWIYVNHGLTIIDMVDDLGVEDEYTIKSVFEALGY